MLEDKKKDRLRKILDKITDATLLTKVPKELTKKAYSLLQGKLTKEKEFTIKGLLSDIKLSEGDRGMAETIPKKEFGKSLNKLKPHPLINDKGERRIFKNMRASNDKKYKGHTGRG